MTAEQKFLPGFEELLRPTDKVHSRFPQPQKNVVSTLPSIFELRYHPLDLGFRGRLNSWLRQTMESGHFDLEEVLPPSTVAQVKLYLFPQGQSAQWLTQEEVSAQVTGDPRPRRFRYHLLLSLAKIRRRSLVGSDAIETLIPNHFLYMSLVRQGIQTMKQIENLSPLDLAHVCGNRTVFDHLKECMHRFHPDWDPQVIFRQDLPPDQALRL